MPEFNNLLEAEAHAAGREVNPADFPKMDPQPTFEEQEVLPIEKPVIKLDPQPIFDEPVAEVVVDESVVDEKPAKDTKTEK